MQPKLQRRRQIKRQARWVHYLLRVTLHSQLCAYCCALTTNKNSASVAQVIVYAFLIKGVYIINLCVFHRDRLAMLYKTFQGSEVN